MRKLTATFLISVVLLLVASCGGGKPVPSQYQGDWTGANGATLYMHSDGKAGFRIGSKKVTGGGAVLDENAKTLTISLFGISETWKIDQEPNDKGEMTLNGTVFQRK